MNHKQMADIRLLNADLFRLIANCFDFPSQDKLFNIREIAAGLKEADYPAGGISNMLQSLLDAMNEEEILNAYSVIFIKGGVPLSETHLLRKYNCVSDVSAFYKAFGFSPRSGENPDSIMYQLEFLALLLVKAAIAPDEEARQITMKAYRDFLSEHTGEFALQLAARIREGQPGAYFLTVSYLLEALIQQELSQLK